MKRQEGKLKTAETRPCYQVYLLRLWREQTASAEHPAAWRFVLEDPKTRQRRGFANLQALMAFLGEIVSDGFAKPTTALAESSQNPKEEETR